MSGQRSILLRPLIMIPLCSSVANKSDVLHPRGIIIIWVKYLDYTELALSTKLQKKKTRWKKWRGSFSPSLNLHLWLAVVIASAWERVTDLTLCNCLIDEMKCFGIDHAGRPIVCLEKGRRTHVVALGSKRCTSIIEKQRSRVPSSF